MRLAALLATSRLFALSPDRSFSSPGDVFALAPSGRELWALKGKVSHLVRYQLPN